MPNPVQLRYTSIKDLVAKCHIDYKGKKPLEIYKRLPEMCRQAEAFKKQGDEEAQFIMLRRWINSVEWLKRTPEYRDGRSNALLSISINQINEVKNVLADLDRKLSKRYEQRAREKILQLNGAVEEMDLDIDTSMTIDSLMPPIDCPLGLPETPTKDPMCADNEEFISCEQLYQLLTKSDNRYLIIDIRPKHQYETSRISFNKCVNIPESEIRLGVLPSHLEKYLRKDKTALDLFRHRGSQYTDVLVLLDWNTTTKPLPTTNHLYILKQILEEWDPGIKYSRITILDGGYFEWLNRYPAFTSNPKIPEPNSNNVPDEISEDIVYPEWMHSDDEDIIIRPGAKVKHREWTQSDEENNVKRRESKVGDYESTDKRDSVRKTDPSGDKARVKSELEIGNGALFDSIVPQPMEVDQISRPRGAILRQYENESVKHQYKRPSKPNEILTKPVIDRSSKPTTLKSNPEAGIILKLMRELNDIAKNNEKLEADILEQERSLYLIGDKYKGTNEEENIHRNLRALYTKLEETQRFSESIEEELAKYSKQMSSVVFTRTEKIEKDNLKLNLHSLKFRIKSISAEREKLRVKSLEKELKEASKKESGSHKEPLKSEHTPITGGLERSYSSPNLLQLGDRKAPRVDRSSKPQVPLNKRNGSISNENVKVPHISWANREERMTPVHGSVHPGITGLKNLGNSCYMNSIIQCLSNTTHLAKYFTDNLYTGDLNTSDSTTQGQVVEEVAQVIKALWRGQYKSISPHDLKVAVGQYKLQFESYEQQDSHEFLTFLLDWMHNDLKKKSRTQMKMTVADKAWDKAMGSQKSIISDLFFGQLRSTITCSSCKQGSTTYETFNSLTTSLPHSNRCTLNDCIQRFVTGQKVVGWKCPKCQMPREAMKKFDFVKLPPIIVIHLNRFAESGGWLEKRNTAVDFPLTGFNLKRFLVTDSIDTDIRSYNYNLYAMSNHYGTMEGGHYTAFCKNAAQNKWYKYDDQTVTEVTSSQVKSQNTSAYLLFYTSFSSNIM